MKFGDRYTYIGGAFQLTPGTLEKAITIEEKQLRDAQNRLRLWRSNPGHESFAHDMKWHGPDIIDHLVNAHVVWGCRQLERLRALQPGGQLLMEFM